MQTTYIVTKGQQWDAEGARVEHGSLSGGYRRDGRFDVGHNPATAHSAAVEAAVLRVIATGQAETVICGEPDQAMTLAPAMAGYCSRCGSYCYGDCRS